MASANHDLNHVRLSRKIQDAVAAAGTDGTKVSSALRNDYLNAANKYIQQFFRTRPDVEVWLQGLIGTEGITFDTAGAAITTDPSDYSYFLTCTKDGTAETGDVVLKFIEPSRKTAMDNKLNPNLQDCFTVLGNLLYAYVNNAKLISGTGKLKYVKTDYKASAAASSDIAIDALWYDALVELAATFHAEDRLGLTNAEEKRKAIVLSVIG